MNSDIRQSRYEKLRQLAKLKHDQDAVSLKSATDIFRSAELEFENARNEHQRALHQSPVEQTLHSVANQDLADHARFVVFQGQRLESASQRLQDTQQLVNETRKAYDRSRLQLERCRKLVEITRQESEIAERKSEQAEQDAAAALRNYHGIEIPPRSA
ncbi:MAG: hypothetical protein AB8B50_00960 [Pirellulaceae bacterium]